MPGVMREAAMTLDKREKNMLYVLAVVLVIFLVDFFVNSEDYAWLTGTGDGEQRVVERVKPKITQPRASGDEPDVVAVLDWGRDPFFDPSLVVKKKKTRKVKKTVSLNLKAISMAESGSVAMINDLILTVGDQVSGYTVVRIDPKTVELKKEGKSRILKLK